MPFTTPAREHPLTVAARSWLGRDAFSADPIEDARPEADIRLTSEPRRYGFHATLKAPFRLTEGTSVKDLEQALSRFAASRAPCPIGPLRIDLLGGFFALVPASPIPTLRSFAAQIVEELDTVPGADGRRRPRAAHEPPTRRGRDAQPRHLGLSLCVFIRLFEACSDEPDMEYAMVDATIVKVHRHGQGAKGGLKARP